MPQVYGALLSDLPDMPQLSEIDVSNVFADVFDENSHNDSAGMRTHLLYMVSSLNFA